MNLFGWVAISTLFAVASPAFGEDSKTDSIAEYKSKTYLQNIWGTTLRCHLPSTVHTTYDVALTVDEILRYLENSWTNGYSIPSDSINTGFVNYKPKTKKDNLKCSTTITAIPPERYWRNNV